VRTDGWRCPFCNQIASSAETDEFEGVLRSDDCVDGHKALVGRFTVCPNRACKKYELQVYLYVAFLTPGLQYQPVGRAIKTWRLVPESDAKVFPEYVPAPVIADYREACIIRDFSPKASATLARRALQGMIRDFWHIRKRTLAKEIQALEGKVDPQTWKAIKAVKDVGNIGAHMEKDINLIVDVEPEEAAKLIRLIELLIQDWYINRAEREKNANDLIALAESKKALRAQK
jgi:hypothetical protein